MIVEEVVEAMDEVAVAADGHAIAAHAALVSSTYGAASMFTNKPLVTAFVSFVVAQSLKVFTTWYKEKRWDLRCLYSSGGVPSSHSATVMGLAVAIGLGDGLGGPLLAIAFVLASVVMYDASGVHLQAGRQAEVLNQIVHDLPSEHPLSDMRPFREFLGHTPLQVLAGALLGSLIACTLHVLSLICAGT